MEYLPAFSLTAPVIVIILPTIAVEILLAFDFIAFASGPHKQAAAVTVFVESTAKCGILRCTGLLTGRSRHYEKD